jgi:hypothetical protein
VRDSGSGGGGDSKHDGAGVAEQWGMCRPVSEQYGAMQAMYVW